MSNGDESFVQALRLAMSEEDPIQELRLFLEALQAGLSKRADEALANADVALIYLKGDDRNLNAAIEHFKRAFVIRRELEADPTMEFFWNNCRFKFGLALCILGKDAEAAGDQDAALSKWREAVEWTDSPDAHLILVETFLLEDTKRDIRTARQHAEYIIANEKKLGTFENYAKNKNRAEELLSLASDLESLQKSPVKAVGRIGTTCATATSFARESGAHFRSSGGDRVREPRRARTPPDLCRVENSVEEVRGLLDAGRVADAIDLARGAVEANPRDSETHWILGLAYSDFNESEKAIEALKDAISIRPNQPFYHFDLGNLYESHGEWQSALQCYERAHAIDRSVLMYEAAQGCVLVKMERYAEGITILEQCVKQEPENRAYISFLAVAYADGSCIGWTKVEEETDLLEPGTYATSLEQVQFAQEAVAKALSLSVDDVELSTHIRSVKIDIDRMTKRRFMGSWKVVAVFGVIGLAAVSGGAFGGLIWTGLAALYAVSTYIPQYIVNQQLVRGKKFDDFGWINRLARPFREVDNVIVIWIVAFSVLFLTAFALPFFAFYNLYRYQKDTIHGWLTSSENKERLSELMSKAQVVSKQTVDAASERFQKLTSEENKNKLSAVVAKVQSATKQTVSATTDTFQNLVSPRSQVKLGSTASLPGDKVMDEIRAPPPIAASNNHAECGTPANSNARYCTECGNPVASSDRYCTECGNPCH